MQNQNQIELIDIWYHHLRKKIKKDWLWSLQLEKSVINRYQRLGLPVSTFLHWKVNLGYWSRDISQILNDKIDPNTNFAKLPSVNHITGRKIGNKNCLNADEFVEILWGFTKFFFKHAESFSFLSWKKSFIPNKYTRDRNVLSM